MLADNTGRGAPVARYAAVNTVSTVPVSASSGGIWATAPIGAGWYGEAPAFASDMGQYGACNASRA